MTDVPSWLDPTVALVLLTCGALAWARRARSRIGPLMVLAGACWLLGAWFAPAVLLHRGPIVHLHLSYPTGRLHRRSAQAAVAAGYGAAVLAVGAWLSLGLAFVVMLAAVDLFAHASGRARKAAGPALAAAFGFALALAASCLNTLLRWEADQAVLLAYDVTIISVALTLTTDLLWGRWTDATVADLVSQLGARDTATGLTGELRRAVGDPTLQAGFLVAETGVFVDDAGRALDLAAEGKAVTRIDDEHGAPIAVLLHDPTALDDADLLEGVAAAVRLALTSARLRLQVNAQVSELAHARRRLAQTADEQRRALVRELEEGPGRRLADAYDVLTTVHQPAGRALLAPVLQDLQDAQQDLRRFAQGVRPVELDRDGLHAALSVLASRMPIPIDVAAPDGRLAPTVEAAVYFICAEAVSNIVKHANAAHASVSVVVDEVNVVASITDDGVGGVDRATFGRGLSGLVDRLDSMNGRILVEDGPDGGTILVATIPLSRDE